MATEPEPIWTPSRQRIASSAMDRFRRRYRPQDSDSTALHHWSVTHPDRFWDAAWDHLGVVGDRGSAGAVSPPDARPMRRARFFSDSAVSYAENLLAGAGLSGASDEAIVFHREDGVTRRMTWAELEQRVRGLAAWLVGRGVGRGDVVAAWMPNTPETVIAMLSANAIGAIFTSTSPDFGVTGVVERFGQVEPVVLIMADGYVYGGRQHRRSQDAPELADRLPSVRDLVVVGELEAEPALPDCAGTAVSRFSEATTGGFAGFERVSPAHPGFILYSSGTTGRPKCIMHSATGVLLKHRVEHVLHCDMRPGDRFFHFTTCGWMMWNWLVTGLASGATLVLYDGSPFHTADVLWGLAERERVTLFGTSAKYLHAGAKAGVRPGREHDLSAIRTVTSTGSPLSAEGFRFVHDAVGPSIHPASISGGTDLCGCLVLGDPTRPVYAGQIQGPALGLLIDVVDDSGESLRDRPGERGDLTCETGFPSMPLGFVDDPDQERYRAAYFDRFPGRWAQGDFASWTDEGGIVVHGRSDATLNAAGVRIGTAEIYRQVEQLPAVAEALAIGQEWDGDTRIVLFVRMARGGLTTDLVAEIRTRLREHCSPRHVPARVLQVSDLPRTRSGKIAELAVSDVVHGRAVRSTQGLANPEVLAEFAERPELVN